MAPHASTSIRPAHVTDGAIASERQRRSPNLPRVAGASGFAVTAALLEVRGAAACARVFFCPPTGGKVISTSGEEVRGFALQAGRHASNGAVLGHPGKLAL